MWTQKLRWNQRPAIQPTVLSGCFVMPFDMWQISLFIQPQLEEWSSTLGQPMFVQRWVVLSRKFSFTVYTQSFLFFGGGHAGDCLISTSPFLGDLILVTL
jgi:hypothetical protein